MASGVENLQQLTFIRAIGRGGFGVVYLADLRTSQNLVQRVAVKVLNLDASQNAEVAARQRDEARLLVQLNHEHIVKVYDLVDVHGRPAVIMEYLEGVDAEALARQGPVPPGAALQIGAAVASALDAAYNSVSPQTGRPLRAIHRDIKPQNIVVTQNGGVKVLDFGTARADFEREGQTRSLQFGTLAFMSPEQILGKDFDERVDIYALGLTIIRLLIGEQVERLPASREVFPARVEALFAKVDGPGWPRPWRAQLIRQLRAMIAFDSRERPSAADTVEACLAISEGAPGTSLIRYARQMVPPLVHANRAQPDDEAPLAPTRVSIATAPSLAEPAPRASRGARMSASAWVVALAGLFALCAAGLAYAAWLWRSGTPVVEVAPPHDVIGATTTLRAPPAPPRQVSAPVSAPVSATPHASTRAPAPATTSASATAPRASAPAPTPAHASTDLTEAKSVAAAPAYTSTAAAAPTREISLATDAVGAVLYVDGRSMGGSSAKIALSEGDHLLTVLVGYEVSEAYKITVGGRRPTHYTWVSADRQWVGTM